MSTTYDQIQSGWSAHGRDGEKIGEIEEIGQNYLLVTKGLIFPKDLYIPMSIVRSVDSSEGQVILDVDKSQVDDMGWDQPPEATGPGSWDTGSGSGVYDAQTTDTGTADYRTTDTSYAASDASYGSTQDASYATSQGTTGSDSTEGDTLRVPVHEEQLRAERVADQAGEVRVDRNVVEEERSIDVPVTREEVEVRRVPVSGSASTDASAFQDGDTIRVPVTEEQVVVTKEPRVVEEIEISKRQVTENQRVSDTVRREEVNVDDSSVRSGIGTSGYGSDASYASGTTDTASTSYDTTTSDDDRSRGRRGDSGEVGGEAIGGGAGALGGAVIGGVVGGPIGAAVGGVIGGAGGAVAGESAEGGDEQGGSGVGGAAGALGGAVVGGAIAGPPGAVVGGAVGAGAGSGAGDKATEDEDDDLSRR